MLLVWCNPVLSVIWWCHQWLNQIPHQTFLLRRVARYLAELKTSHVKGWMNLLVGSMATKHSECMYAASMVMTCHCWAECFLDWSHWLRMEGSPDGINSNVSVTKASLQVREHRLWFDLESDRFHQVNLHKTHYAWLTISPAFNTDMWRELDRRSAVSWSYNHTWSWDWWW